MCLSTNFGRTAAQVEKSISLIFCTKIGSCEKLNGLQLVSPDTASFRRNMQKTISPLSWAQNPLPVRLNFVIVSRIILQLFMNLSMIFIISSGLHCMTERKIKQIEIVLSPKRAKTGRLNLQMCRKRNYAVKHCHFFLWAITLNIVKILSMGNLYTHLL